MQSGHAKDRAQRVAGVGLSLCAIAVMFIAAACGTPSVQHPHRVAPPDPAVLHAGSTEAAREAYASAQALYDLGRFEEAAEELRLWSATWPHDPQLPMVELLLGRALLAANRPAEAELVWEELRRVPTWAAAAGLYLAFLSASIGQDSERDARLQRLLREHPGVRVQAETSIPGDEILLAALLAEERMRAGRPAEALPDLDVVAEQAQEPRWARYAWARAQSVVYGLNPPLPVDLSALHGLRLSATLVALRRAELALAEGRTAEVAGLLPALSPALQRWGQDELAVELYGRSAYAERDARLRYGLVLSITGPDRRAGRAALGAVLLAQRSFVPEEALSVVLIEDAGGDVERTRLAVARVVERGALAVIGPIEAPLDAVAREEAARLGVAYIGLSPIPWERAVGTSLRLQVDAASEARRVLDEAVQTREVSRVVLFEEEGAPAYLVAYANAMEAAAAALGVTLVERVRIDARPDQLQASAAAAVRRVHRMTMDGVALALTETTASVVTAHMTSQDIWSATGAPAARDRRRRVTYLGHSFLVGDALLRNSAEYVEGALVPIWFSPELAVGRGSAFRGEFLATYGREPGTVEAFAYDAAWLLRHLLVVEGVRSRASMIARLARGAFPEGVVGPLAFDAAGNLQGSPGLATVQGGRLLAR